MAFITIYYSKFNIHLHSNYIQKVMNKEDITIYLHQSPDFLPSELRFPILFFKDNKNKAIKENMIDTFPELLDLFICETKQSTGEYSSIMKTYDLSFKLTEIGFKTQIMI